MDIFTVFSSLSSLIHTDDQFVKPRDFRGKPGNKITVTVLILSSPYRINIKWGFSGEGRLLHGGCTETAEWGGDVEKSNWSPHGSHVQTR